MFEIGNTLKEARLRRHIDLVEAEQDTKIRSKYLAALEEEDFEVLPGPVYARGFLRTYTGYLGLDSQLYIDEYNARFGRYAEPEEQPVLAARPRQSRSRFPTLHTLTALSVVAIAGLVWLGLTGKPATTEPGPVATGQVSGGGTSNPNWFERHPVGGQPAAPGKAVAGKASRPTPAAPKRAQLTITARGGASWIEVRRNAPNGEVLYSGTLSDGTQRSFKARQLHVVVGYPSVTVLSLRGGRSLEPTTTTASRYVVTPRRIRLA